MLIVLFTGCNKNQTNIPYVPVDAYININNPAYVDLNVVGGWVYVTGGSRGILIYRSNLDEFRTYDRHATYNINDNCTVIVDNSNLGVEDPCSSSKWIITDGSVTDGPASLPLHQYANTFDGTTLHIFN